MDGGSVQLRVRLIVGLLFYVAAVTFGCGGPFTSERDLVVENPSAAVRDARAMIEERGRNPAKYEVWVAPEDAPRSLQVPKLLHLNVHEDHVDLVLARNPDWNVGGRIWAEVHRPHNDHVTRYPDIFFYDYTNDAPETPDNIR